MKTQTLNSLSLFSAEISTTESYKVFITVSLVHTTMGYTGVGNF